MFQKVREGRDGGAAEQDRREIFSLEASHGRQSSRERANGWAARYFLWKLLTGASPAYWISSFFFLSLHDSFLKKSTLHNFDLVDFLEFFI
jgi:hypothetical protein